MTGRRIALPAGTKIEAGKVKPKRPGYMAGVKAKKAARLEKAWREKAK